jgi:hypothetical protein
MKTITKEGSDNFALDLSTQQITFLDNRFYHTEDGSFVPSVTTILEAYPKGAAFYAWLKQNGEDSDTIRDEAGRRGSIVHSLTERYDNGDEVNLMTEDGYIPYKMVEWAMFERYVEFRNKIKLSVLHTELRLVDTDLGFAGTIDRVIELNGKKVLIDIKTSGSVWPSYWLQLAAYRKLLENHYGADTIDEVAILWLNAKTRTEGRNGAIQGIGWQLITRSASDCEKDWQLFKATHQLWLAENDTAKPRNTTYKISHQFSSL